MMPTARRSRGFTLVEALGALAVVGLVAAGAMAVVNSGLEDMRGHHAARHQAQVTAASERYVREHYADLVAATATAPVAVPIGTLTPLLPANFADTNAYGQTPCVRVVQPAAGRLNVLVVAEGGESIPAKTLAYVAAQAGAGGGQISVDDPAIAQGAFGAWRVNVGTYGGAACGPASGGPAANRLASALFFDGASTGPDLLYRGEVAGQPELNAMRTPIGMIDSAGALDGDATDPRCNVADPMSQGRIATQFGTGLVLTCQNGTWHTQASPFWKEPVATYGLLPAGEAVGEARMTLDTMRTFAWDGLAWRAFAVDQNGDLDTPRQVALEAVVVKETPCTPLGAVSRDAQGVMMSCQAGGWKSVGTVELDPAQSEIGRSVIMRSNYRTEPPGTPFFGGPYTYDAANNVVIATIDRPVRPAKDGLFVSNATVDMSVGTVGTPTDTADVALVGRVIDNDTGAVVATNQAYRGKFVYDRAILAVSVSKAVPVNVNGYTYRMEVRWTRREGTYASNFYDRSNYLDAFGNTVELIPIDLLWNFDLTY